MIDIVGKKKWYFAFSALVLVPGIVALFLWRLNLGVDFTGGTLVELSFLNKVNKSALESSIEKNNIEVSSIASTDAGTYLIRTKPLNDVQRKSILEVANKEFGEVRQGSHETIGPIIGAELLRKALISLAVASAAIVFYIAWAFRSVPTPASSS